ncbi:MAG TPA: caspase family protein [Oleiagrimonas sp.]|nr:caspase family protein [Oleiagrimonas sp.]
MASGKYALVLGNAHYRGADRLTTPDNDARLIAGRFKALGFEVTMHVDRNRREFLADMQDFVRKAQGADIVAFYYAGHGFEVGKDNFLLPLGMSRPLAQLSRSNLRREGIALRNVRGALARTGAKARLLFIDACRTAPNRGARARGMRKAVAGNGVLLAWSTAPGSAAVDSMRQLGRDVDNSPFAWYLAHDLADGHAGIVQVLRRVQQQVATVTGNSQRPWFTSGLVGTVKLAGPTAASAGAPLRNRVATNTMTRGVGPHGNVAARRLWDREAQVIVRALRTLDAPGVRLLKRREQAGDSRAATILGDAYATGVVVKASRKPALRYYRQAAAAGYVPAKTRLGEVYFEGRMVPRDLSRSERWLAQAASAGATRAVLDLAQVRNVRGEANAKRTNMRALKQMGTALRDALKRQWDAVEQQPGPGQGSTTPTD